MSVKNNVPIGTVKCPEEGCVAEASVMQGGKPTNYFYTRFPSGGCAKKPLGKGCCLQSRNRKFQHYVRENSKFFNPADVRTPFCLTEKQLSIPMITLADNLKSITVDVPADMKNISDVEVTLAGVRVPEAMQEKKQDVITALDNAVLEVKRSEADGGAQTGAAFATLFFSLLLAIVGGR